MGDGDSIVYWACSSMASGGDVKGPSGRGKSSIMKGQHPQAINMKLLPPIGKEEIGYGNPSKFRFKQEFRHRA